MALIDAPVLLALPVENRPLLVNTDFLDYEIGVILLHQQGNDNSINW